MSPLKKLILLPLIVVQLACVKDTNLDQYNEIVIPPSVEIDLIYFDLQVEDFYDQEGEEKSASDELRLEFLDDDYIQDGLVTAEFNFIYTNYFTREFKSIISFLSEGGTVLYSFPISVPAGSENSPAVLNYKEIIPRSQIDALKKSIWMKVEVEMVSNENQVEEGKLQLESKGLYKFEF